MKKRRGREGKGVRKVKKQGITTISKPKKWKITHDANKKESFLRQQPINLERLTDKYDQFKEIFKTSWSNSLASSVEISGGGGGQEGRRGRSASAFFLSFFFCHAYIFYLCIYFLVCFQSVLIFILPFLYLFKKLFFDSLSFFDPFIFSQILVLFSH